MKKNYLFLSLLSLFGILLSFFLVVDYYLPGITKLLFSCSGSYCAPVSRSSALSFFHVPFSVFAFFFFLWFFLSLHLFWESGRGYWSFLTLFLFPFTLLEVVYILLAAVLVTLGLKTFPLFLLVLFTIAAVTLFMLYLWIREEKPELGLKKLFSIINSNEDRKFSSGTYIYFTVILFLFVITFAFFMNEKYGVSADNHRKIDAYLSKYKELSPIEEELPLSPLVAGDPQAPLVLYLFTDPLCPACTRFHETSKALLERYQGKLQVRYYFYPLDSTCNSGISTEFHPGSCTASRLFYAAHKSGQFSDVMRNFYDNYRQLSQMVAEKKDPWVIAGSLSEEKKDELVTAYNDEEIESLLQEHIALADKIGLDATPTFVINGRLKSGAPSKEAMEAIIEYELGNLK